jgi:hypothetical protein
MVRHFRVLMHRFYPDRVIGCSTNYHHDYSVKDDIRTYYGGIPSVVHVGDHQFVERDVLNLFIALMLNSW